LPYSFWFNFTYSCILRFIIFNDELNKRFSLNYFFITYINNYIYRNDESFPIDELKDIFRSYQSDVKQDDIKDINLIFPK
jgi:hypothetical protein